jgi:hypothetical protein
MAWAITRDWERLAMGAKREFWQGFALVVCVVAFACTGCCSRKVYVHGQSGIMSFEARQRLGHMALEGATEQDVITLLGEPADRPVEPAYDRSLYYSCVVTTRRDYYLFSPKAIVDGSMDTDMYTCRVYLGPEGTVRFVDYRSGNSNETIRPVPLPRPYE